MSLINDVKQYYRAIAPVYDEIAGYNDLEAEKLRIPIKNRYKRIFRGNKVLEIACGTGYWTKVIGEVSESLLAIDINPYLISVAKDRCKHLPCVEFQVADAYSLKGVSADFTASFSNWWWSHIPKARITSFLSVLHSKLVPGALVMFIDHLPSYGNPGRRDTKRNNIETRSLQDGRTFEIVKNFPTKNEIMTILGDIADNVEYIERPDEKSWNLIYRVRK